MAVAGVLLFQIRFFDTGTDGRDQSSADPRVRLLMLIVLAATLFGCLEAMREGGGRWVAVSVTVGLAISLLPILLRVLPPLRRDVQTGQRRPDFWVTLLGLILYAAVVALVTDRTTRHGFENCPSGLRDGKTWLLDIGRVLGLFGQRAVYRRTAHA